MKPLAWLTAVASAAGLAPVSRGQVVIDGGRDPVQVNFYRWTVTNRGGRAITRFEFPRYLVDDLASPTGWTHEIVKTDSTGRAIKPHRIVYKANSAASAIHAGGSLVFEAQINIDKATPGRQPVTIGFDDGSTIQIADVEIPWDYPWLEKHALLIGMGSLFAVFLIVQAIRSRRQKPAGSPAG